MEAASGVHVVDTGMWGVEGWTAAFVIDADNPVVVDAGLEGDADRVLAALDELDVDRRDVEDVVVSHVHLDHAGGVPRLLEECPNAVARVHPRGRPYLVDEDRVEALLEGVRAAMGSMADAYGGLTTVEEERVETLEDGELLDLGSHELEVVYATGHAPHHVSLYERTTESLFVVDEGCAYFDGRELCTTPPSDFDLERTLDSFETFESLEPEWLLYGHFGANDAGVEAVDRHRRVLVDWVDAVERAWSETEDLERTLDRAVEAVGFDDDDPLLRGMLARDVRGVLGYLGVEL
ncbi:MAG: MBL fold metallo-hydrolase [Halobacteriota archaeon]